MDYQRHRTALETRQTEILERLQATDSYGLMDPEREETGELSAYDNHPADIGSEVFEREKDIALRDNDRLQLAAIERALQAMEDGTYGQCQHCGTAIPKERLDVLPTAILCTACKDAEEQLRPDRMRPVEEEYLYPGFARSDLDDTSAVEFDGEDAWQAVARYNERPDYQTDGELGYLDDNEGLVEATDGISNELYKRGRLS